MEKLDLQTFRNLKQEVVDKIEIIMKFVELYEIQKSDENYEYDDISKYEFDAINRYKEIIKTLLQYDLSDIDFEEWRGFFLWSSKEIPLDFSKTKANLDFSIIFYIQDDKTLPNLKSCKIKNFDFYRYKYTRNMFDEDFVKENIEKFLSADIPQEVTERFYNCETTLTDIKTYTELANKVQEKNIGDPDLQKIYMSIGKEEFLKLDAKLIDRIKKSRGDLYTRDLNNSKTAEDIYKKLLIGNSIMTSYDSTQKSIFIEKYGISNIIEFDKETGGCFSKRIGQEEEDLLFLIANQEQIMPKVEKHKELTYEQFRDRMYEILLHFGEEKGLLASQWFNRSYLDLIQGRFREEHPDIFIDGDIQEYEKKAFYARHMTAEMVRQNPRLIQLLQGKDLSRAFPQEITVGIGLAKIDKDKNTIGEIPNTVNMAQYFSEKIGQEEFLKICADYGKCLDSINLIVNEENEVTLENIRNNIEEAIYKKIKKSGIEYFESLPISFQEKYPELFLPKEIDQDIRKRFYEGGLSYEDIRKNPQIKQVLLTKDIDVGFGRLKYAREPGGERYVLGSDGQRIKKTIWENLSEQEIMDLAEQYGDYLKYINVFSFINHKNEHDRNSAIQIIIENNIFKRNKNFPFNENVPTFFREKYPEMFLDSNAPEELKNSFYDGGEINFQLIKEHREYLKGKDLSRAFSEEYSELFKRFDSSTLMKLGTRNPETIEKMVQNHREDALEKWYKSTGGKFVPHHVVMLNFPESEIDSFLGNSKRWSQLNRIDNYNLKDAGNATILKASYAMGVFQDNDEGFNKTIKLFTDVPQDLSQDEYGKVKQLFKREFETSGSEDTKHQKMKALFEKAYRLNDDKGNYILILDKQNDKKSIRIIREILEKAQIPRILTPEKAHQMFDSFAMKYNPDFFRFFSENVEEILSNPEFTKDIATIQRQFSDIIRTNAGRRVTLDVAQDFVKSIAYTDMEIGNEGVAEQAKIAGYSQTDFEAIQSLFNEGEMRDFSSIPRIQGRANGYTYEMLRLDDPLALTIGTLTDCCQRIHKEGETSMEHSVVSPDGRVFVVKNEEGKIVAQSWFWRNQHVGCFDNIEIPERIIAEYEKKHSDFGRKGLTADVLEVYKKATQELMKEDERVYQQLLENGTITQEQYDSLLLGRVTIGAGYNDIKNALREAHSKGEFRLDATNEILPKKTERLRYIYDDAHYEDDGEHDGQYIISEREGIVKSKHENLYVHQDDVPVYDGTNMSSTVLFTMKRMEQATKRDNLAYLSERSDEANLPKSKRIINSIAREYGFDPDSTKVMATARIALIYSKDKDKIRIGDLLSSPLKEDLNEEQKQKATAHIMYQVKKALKQIGVQNSKVDISSLSKEQQQMLQSVMQEIEKENDERGGR